MLMYFPDSMDLGPYLPERLIRHVLHQLRHRRDGRSQYRHLVAHWGRRHGAPLCHLTTSWDGSNPLDRVTLFTLMALALRVKFPESTPPLTVMSYCRSSGDYDEAEAVEIGREWRRLHTIDDQLITPVYPN